MVGNYLRRDCFVGLVLSAVVPFSFSGCNVDEDKPSTGGVSLGGSAGDSGTSTLEGGATEGGSGGVGGTAGDSGTAGEAGETQVSCGRALAVVMSDYMSTNIAISDLDGKTLSGSFVSSAATKPGLALAISGDVVVPSSAPASKQVVIVDRYGTNVITWMSLADASVIAQLPVGTGFESNPHDYIEVSEDRAYVSRFGSNLDAGRQEYDEGGDLLIIDTRTPKIVGRIAMPEEDERLLPRPGIMTSLGDQVVVSLGRWSADYATVGDGRYIGVDPKTDKVTWTVDIEELQACGGLALSPTKKLGAIACSSKYNSTTSEFSPAHSDIVIYDTTVSPPKELRRLGVAEALDSGLQPDLVFATENTILAKSYGGNATTGDTVFTVNATTGKVTKLAESEKPYSFGGLFCSPGCSDNCLMADADKGVLRRWSVNSSGEFTELDDVTVETDIGFPPRSVGAL